MFFCQWLFTAFSQPGTRSPFSRYGLGFAPAISFASERGLGMTSLARRNPFTINLANPASLSAFPQKSFTFETGVENNLLLGRAPDFRYRDDQVALGYIAMGFPVAKGWGSCLGIRPFSKMDFSVRSSLQTENSSLIQYAYEGRGGLNQFFWGNGFQFGDFSLGANLSYLFGPLEYTTREVTGVSNAFNLYHTRAAQVGDLFFSTGIQHEISWGSPDRKEEKWKLILGSAVDFSQKLSASYSESALTYTGGSDPLSYVPGFFNPPKDTLLFREESIALLLPKSYGIGFSLGRGSRWNVAADYRLRNWDDFAFPGSGDTLGDEQRFSVGGECQPEGVGVGPYWKKIIYRLGGYYHTLPLRSSGTTVEEYGLTIGWGFPMKRAGSTLNLSGEGGSRNTGGRLPQEKYLIITLGLTMNDVWFVRPKID